MNFLRFSIWQNRVAFCSFNQIFVSGYQNQVINSCRCGNEPIGRILAGKIYQPALHGNFVIESGLFKWQGI